MNLNEFFVTELANEIGIPVSQDIYDGKSDKYIVFSYQDERPDAYADNCPISDTCEVYVSLYVPKSYRYFELKDKVRDCLEKNHFSVSMQVWLEETKKETEWIRRIVFDCSTSRQRK